MIRCPPLASVTFDSAPRPSLRRSLLVLLLVAGFIQPAAAQLRSRPILEPQALRIQIIEAYTGVYMEAIHEETDFGGPSGPVKYNRIFVGPLIGLKAAGSIYHPNLMTFTLSGEGSPGYSHERTRAAVSADRNEFRFLGNYIANLTLLGSRPYRSVFSLSQSYHYRDYDFFNRVEVDTMRYSAAFGYQAGPVPFSVNVWRRTEETYGLTSDSKLEEVGLTFDARNERERGASSFNYTFSDYTRRDLALRGGGTDHSFGVTDIETFGSRNQILFNTSAGYSMREYTDSPSDDLNASAGLSIEHTPTVSTFYDAGYYRSWAESGGATVDSDNFNGGMSLRHQLYESLTSTLRLQGLHFTSSGSFTDTNNVTTQTRSETIRFGGGITEQYVKRLGDSSRLSALGSFMLEHTRQNNSGPVLIQIDEPHSFPAGDNPSDTFFLNLPYVDEFSIVITDGANSEPAFQEGIDYTVSRNGALTLIRRTPLSNIPQGTVVLVDYQAIASPSGEYDTLTGLFQVRFDFWNGLLGVYGRVNSVRNDGPEELIIQDITSVAFGADTSWRWLRAGAEYEIYDSTFSSYRTARMFQSLAFRPDQDSSLNFDFIQSWTRYLDADRTEQNYSFLSRYRRAVTRHLGLNVEGGYSMRIGRGVDQSLATFRPAIDWRIGQLQVRAGYDFQYGRFLHSEERTKHMLFVRARRSF
jgi:hypothetical protein